MQLPDKCPGCGAADHDFRIEAAASRLLAALMWVENGGAKADSPAMWGEIEAAIAQAKQAGIEPVGRTTES